MFVVNWQVKKFSGKASRIFQDQVIQEVEPLRTDW